MTSEKISIPSRCGLWLQTETFGLSRQPINPFLFVFSKLDREWPKEINWLLKTTLKGGWITQTLFIQSEYLNLSYEHRKLPKTSALEKTFLMPSLPIVQSFNTMETASVFHTPKNKLWKHYARCLKAYETYPTKKFFTILRISTALF